MKTIHVNQNRISDPKNVVALCPFGAIENHNGTVVVTEECRMCQLCIKNGAEGAFTLVDEVVRDYSQIDKEAWKGILVYVEHHDGRIHPVSLEMMGKAHVLAKKVHHPVQCVIIGDEVEPLVKELLCYGPDIIVAYENREFSDFKIEPYTAAMVDVIDYLKPAVVLVGGTTNGRTLAPRAAARLGTGLTADCTVLDIQENSDLDQIRPAFGGNIMAHIRTPNHRPQFATVRYKIFDVAQQVSNPCTTVEYRKLPAKALKSSITILKKEIKGTGEFIEEADVIVAIGKGIGKPENIVIFEKLANMLGGQVACTRPLVEEGWMDPRKQIGLSGRTVKPKLILACGVSGSVQFVAGMQGSERIIAINSDPEAAIFKVAHIGLVGDIFTIIPDILSSIENESIIQAKDAQERKSS